MGMIEGIKVQYYTIRMIAHFCSTADCLPNIYDLISLW